MAAMLQQTGIAVSDIQAVAVSNGPGSYTGLRVGLAAAKGLCFALHIPLITLNTLDIMAKAMQQMEPKADAYCPMIDARRMEVFTALYDSTLKPLHVPTAVLLEEEFLKQERATKRIVYAGSGAGKWTALIQEKNLIIHETDWLAAFKTASWQAFEQQLWADTAYAEPFYCKAFYQPVKAG
jgi:tRNA threonylcarbamoyladenosine biosynthesis protein TsaB